jgi:fatty-acyl-CoA synthase
VQVHFANVWQAIADSLGDARTALIHGDERVSWREYDEQAARLASLFLSLGLGPDSKVALYLYNGIEYAVTQYAAFKMRGVPVNVNYRYSDTELLYLLDNSDAEVLVFHTSLGDRVARVLDRATKLKAIVAVDDGGAGASVEGALAWADVLASQAAAERIEGEPGDVYMLYTGGTTGMPKGVMYAHGVFPLALAGFGAAMTGAGAPPTSVEELLALRARVDHVPVWLAACPQMHGTGMWLGTMAPLLLGGTVVTLTSRSFDADELWAAVEREGVTAVVIVGDAFAKPMLRALEDAPGRYDLSSLRTIISSGVMWSTEVKDGLLRHLDVTLYDGLGSTEGSMGATVSTRASVGTTAQFTASPAVKVVTEDGRVVEPGSDEIGMVAAVSASLGYFKDPDKSARTFKVIDGVPHSLPGDWAKVAADGSLILLGRGSNCINTGGEKVFPEEVEEAVKSHPAVYDCLVVGVEDERFGERIVAVASLRDGASSSGVDEASIVEHAATQIARYKLPKQVLLVDKVQRAPNGKADYPWARSVAAEAVVGD